MYLHSVFYCPFSTLRFFHFPLSTFSTFYFSTFQLFQLSNFPPLPTFHLFQLSNFPTLPTFHLFQLSNFSNIPTFPTFHLLLFRILTFILLHQFFQFFITDGYHSSAVKLFIHPIFDIGNKRIFLIDFLVPFKFIIAINPVSNTR